MFVFQSYVNKIPTNCDGKINKVISITVYWIGIYFNDI
jgi:hypothetical protein